MAQATTPVAVVDWASFQQEAHTVVDSSVAHATPIVKDCVKSCADLSIRSGAQLSAKGIETAVGAILPIPLPFVRTSATALGEQSVIIANPLIDSLVDKASVAAAGSLHKGVDKGVESSISSLERKTT